MNWPIRIPEEEMAIRVKEWKLLDYYVEQLLAGGWTEIKRAITSYEIWISDRSHTWKDYAGYRLKDGYWVRRTSVWTGPSA